jgi:16S rRNA (adenine1518-N6/adenine1519-N6)-dimethyltransferase
VHSPLASPSATIELLQRYGLYTKKSLGQHFLIDDGVIGRILRLADINPRLPIVEIGPGIGTLTEALLFQGAEVLAIEIDERLIPVLDDIKLRYPEQFSYLISDALELSPDQLPEQFDIVANLPYSVAATLVLSAFQQFSGLRSATVMVQAEVADRMMAKPGTKSYGAYTVKLALLASPEGSFKVSPSSFLPPPRVDSTVVQLVKNNTSRLTLDTDHARLIIDAAFANRRKTIRNSMRSALENTGINAAQIDQALAIANIDPSRRAETLSIDEFRKLINYMSSS